MAYRIILSSIKNPITFQLRECVTNRTLCQAMRQLASLLRFRLLVQALEIVLLLKLLMLVNLLMLLKLLMLII